MSEYESAALWSQYSVGDRHICVQSTYRKLHDGLGSTVAGVGVVEYGDYSTDWKTPRHPFYTRYLRKRKSFEHEHEVRALIVNWEPVPSKDGVWRQIDLDALLERIHVAPGCEDWRLDLVQRLVSRYCLNVPVFRSTLDVDPIR